LGKPYLWNVILRCRNCLLVAHVEKLRAFNTETSSEGMSVTLDEVKVARPDIKGYPSVFMLQKVHSTEVIRNSQVIESEDGIQRLIGIGGLFLIVEPLQP
jgi:hypothetical protein